jgi:hypothetical protein
MLQRGFGYRLPTDTTFAPLDNDDNVPSAKEMLQAINLFHDQGLHPSTICFGGGYSEPMASLPEVMEVMTELRSKRHGIPLVLMTNGLSNTNYSGDAAQEIITLHDQWKEAPGSDGDSKLSVFVNIAGANPPQYKKVMQPTETKKGFQEMTAFVARLAEAGVRVYGTASEFPKIKMKQVETMALGIGCSDFFVRTYHERTLYDVLSVNVQDDTATIDHAYREKAKQLHPDLHVGSENEQEYGDKMAEVTEAHSVLSNAEQRMLYDQGVADLVLNEKETDYFASAVNKSA